MTFEVHTDHPKKAPPRRFNLIRFEQLKRKQATAYLIKGIIPSSGLVVIWGAPKSGKSFWTFDALLHVALGREYRDHRVTRARVVYLALEGQDGFGNRADAFRLRHLDDGEHVTGFYLVTERTDLVKDHAELIRCIRSQCDGNPGAVVIDTMNRSLVGSESKDEDMAAYIKAADAIREAFNCTVIIIHHCGIDGTRPRGHTSLTGAADVQISIKRDAEDNIIAELEYAKDMAQGAIIASRLVPVEIGADQDGDEITSCVVVPVETTVTRPEPKKTGETKTIRVFRDAFNEALDGHGGMIRVHGDGPQVKAVDIQKVRDEFKRRYATGEEDPKKRAETANKAFRRTLNTLPSQFATESRDDRELIWRI